MKIKSLLFNNIRISIFDNINKINNITHIKLALEKKMRKFNFFEVRRGYIYLAGVVGRGTDTRCIKIALLTCLSCVN